MFTSGTTGVSKGCVLSHRYAIRTAENLIAPFRITKDDVIYSPYPLSHIGPAYYDILPTMMTGGHVILRDGFSVSNFWPEVKKNNTKYQGAGPLPPRYQKKSLINASTPT